MYFDELDLSDNVLDALYDMHFEQCTPVQEKCIPEILDGNDVLGVAQTGTGKTAAYLLPILSLLDDYDYPKDAVNCLIMSPTRELAQQIDQAMQGFSYYLDGVSSVAVYGGNDGNRYDQEFKSLKLGADVVIATPGRLISHLSLSNVDLSRLSFFVLDEADRMLDMGFSEDILQIAKHIPATCQTIMFSATMPKKIETLAQSLLKNPSVVKLAVSKPAEKIKQSAYVCYESQKTGIIKNLFKQGELHRVIIFSGSKQKVKDIHRNLVRMNIKCGAMHSDLSQAERDEIMFQFKSGTIDVLVATDIIARGIDIDDLEMVINYDVPHDTEDYVHRIGRTARANRDGEAITFVSEDDIYYFQQIEKFLEKTIDKTPLPKELGEGPEYKPNASRPARGGRGGKHGGSKGSRGESKRGGNRSGNKQGQHSRGRSKERNKQHDGTDSNNTTPSKSPAAQDSTQQAAGEKKNKRRYNHHRRNSKNGNGSGEKKEAPAATQTEA